VAWFWNPTGRFKFLIRDPDSKFSRHRPRQGRRREPPLRRPGHAVDITARIEHRPVAGGLISEYRRPA
jgi:hypothetical protein